MSNLDTISAVTDNLQAVLKSLGLHFSLESIEDLSALPASVLPHGRIFYEREDFEYAHGQKPEYATAGFSVVVVMAFTDARSVIRQQQKWAHSIREAMTVNALNVGLLATSKLVALVSVNGVEAAVGEDKATLTCNVTVRYREV